MENTKPNSRATLGSVLICLGNRRCFMIFTALLVFLVKLSKSVE